MIILLIASVVAALCYLGAAFNERYAKLLLAQGVVAHTISLIACIGGLDTAEGFGLGGRYGFAAALSATLWIGALLLLIEGRSVRVQAVLKVILPLAAVAALLPILFPGTSFAKYANRPFFLPHLIVGTLSYGVLMLAALHAGLMASAERALRGGAEKSQSLYAKFFDELPPLMTLERVLFRLIMVSFVCLTLTLISGIGFSEEIFDKPLRFDHKTMFTVTAWFVLGVLLVGRKLWGLRGKVALRWTMASFGFLVLGYVGSRFVLEVILNRAS